MSDERKRLGDLFCVAGAALLEIGKIMGGAVKGAVATGAVASDADLDGEHGNPVVRKTPKNWKGPPMDGRTLSKCTPEFLDFYAEHKDWCSQNPREGKEQYAKYDALDAARARGWAKRLRARAATPSAETAPPQAGGDDWTADQADGWDDAEPRF